MKLNWKMLPAKMYLLFCVITSVTADRIVFPQTDDFPIDCKLSNGETGVCINIRHCLTAQTSTEPMKTCYFQKSEQFVCCGQNAISERIEVRPSALECIPTGPIRHSIAHGEPAAYKEFPYMMALGWESLQSTAYDYRCGGALVSSNYVITAAHCASVNGLSPIVVWPGGVDLTDPLTRPINISQIIVHPKYDARKSYNDIALLKLAEPYEYDVPVCLWDEYELVSTNLSAAGYGHTRFAGTGSNRLLKTTLLAISNQECQKAYVPDETIPSGIKESQICAKDPEKLRDTCQGDSGGPMIMYVNVNKRRLPYLVGITSFGQGCAGAPPGVYTRVSAYLEWIESIVWPKQNNV